MEHTAKAMAKRYELVLIGPRGCRRFVDENVRVLECPSSPLTFLIVATALALREALLRKPSLFVGGNALVAFISAMGGYFGRGRSVVFVHGLDLVAAHWIYQTLFVPWVARNQTVIANSTNTRRLAIAAKCRPERITIVHPGTATPPVPPPRNDMRKSLGLDDSPTVLYAGRIVRRKGLIPFLEQSWPEVSARVPEAQLVVVGDTPKGTLKRDSTDSERLNAFLKTDSAASVQFKGYVEDEELWRYYAAATVFILPLVPIEGDVEGFGMVAIEAAASGTPTVAFAVGGVVDAIADGVSGHLIREGDYQKFSSAVVHALVESHDSEACRKHAAKFSWGRYEEKLLKAVAPRHEG